MKEKESNKKEKMGETRIDEELESELNRQFPKGDKARGKALVLFALAQNKMNKLIENNADNRLIRTDNNCDVKSILHKNFPDIICPYCKKVVNIKSSNDFRKIVARNRTLSEINETLRENWHRWMNIKNGQIESMHKMIAQIIKLIPEESREKSKEITKEMRDEIKYLEKRGKHGKKREEK